MQGVLEIFDALMLAWLYHSVGASWSVNSKERGLPKSCQDVQQVLLKYVASFMIWVSGTLMPSLENI